MDFDKIRETCLSFPGATEGVKWENHICFMVGEKMFCITTIDDGAEDVSIKVCDEDFDRLTERDGIIPAPYMARNKWVRIERYKYLKPKEWKELLRTSYDLIRSKLPKKIQNSLDA
jgi:predicted DNA-binding protein (MmcQ/YjbR family)